MRPPLGTYLTRTVTLWLIAAAVACTDAPTSVTAPTPDLDLSAGTLSHATPTLPLTNTVVGALDPCKAGNAIGTLTSSAAVDRIVGGSDNRFTGQNGSWLAIWANADHDPKELTLDISGSWNVVNGNVVTRSHLKMGGSDNVFLHAVEYGQRSANGKNAFDLSGSKNCFGPQPAQAFRNAPPAAPAGFPFSSQFDPDQDGNVLEHFAPGTAFATAAGANYYQCTASSSPWGAVNTIPSPLTCSTSSGKLSASVQGVQLPPGLYFVSGEVDLSASNLQATVTIVSGGKLKVSGSNQTRFSPFHSNVLFASQHILAPTSANTDKAEDAVSISGSTSSFRGLIVAVNGRTTLSGSQNSFTCPVMGDRVRLSGQNLYIGGEGCQSPPTVVTEIHAVTTADVHTNLGDGLSAVEVGTAVHDKVVVASTSDSNLTGTITLELFDDGTCTGDVLDTGSWTANGGPPGPDGGTFAPAKVVTIDPALPFTPTLGVYSYRASYGGDPDNPGPVIGACEGPLHVVDARIQIDPALGFNEVGDDHDLTITVQVVGGAIALGGAPVTASIENGPGAFVPDSLAGSQCLAASGGDGTASCVVTITSSTPGTTVVSATSGIPIDVDGDGLADIALTRTTDGSTTAGGLENSEPAEKVWVDVAIEIDPASDVNEVGDEHELTITVTVQGGVVAADGAAVTGTIESGPGAFVTPTAGGTCTTSHGTAVESCDLTISSDDVGTTVMSATAVIPIDVTLDGEIDLTITRSTGASVADGAAEKHWVDATIAIAEDAVNEVGDPHDFTVTVTVFGPTGTAVAAPGAAVTGTVDSGPGGFVAPTAAGTCTTTFGSGSESCTLTISSGLPGVTIVSASAEIPITVGGLVTITVSRDTDGSGTLSGETNGDPAEKTWVDLRISLSPLDATNVFPDTHDVTAAVEMHQGGITGWEPVGGTLVAFDLLPPNTAGATFVGGSSCTTALDGTCTITIQPATLGAVEIEGETTVEVSGVSITRASGTQANLDAGGSDNAHKDWVAGGATFLIIDEDSIDNGIRFVENPTVGVQNIFPTTTRVFSALEVNDDQAAIGMRDVLRYFASPTNIGRTIALLTGQVGDEAWFAPNCIPQRWLSGSSDACITDEADRQAAIAAFFAGTVSQDKLDKIPDVRPLRALGLVEKIGETICAVVYDSDIGINYDHGTPLGVNGNLQGATLGIVAFEVLDVVRLTGFSSSSLPEVQVEIVDASLHCPPTNLNDAPIPRSSSEPADVDPATAPASGYSNRP